MTQRAHRKKGEIKVEKRIQNGKLSKTYYFRYTAEDGSRPYINTQRTTEREAIDYVKNTLLPEIQEQQHIKTQLALEEKTAERILKMERGKEITLADGFAKMMEKPRARTTGKKRLHDKEKRYQDFVAFMAANHPKVELLREVNRTHAEQYIAYIRENGKFQSAVEYMRGGQILKYNMSVKYSVDTVNQYHAVLKEVFEKLKDDAHLSVNPFSGIEMQRAEGDQEGRQDFSVEDLEKIWNGFSLPFEVCRFCEPLFRIALATGLREGDICCLKWTSIDFDNRVIILKTRKTKKTVEIPFLFNIEGYLRDLYTVSDGEYVLPEHANMYISGQWSVSTRIKKFLDAVGIENTIIPEGRSRQISIKDLHSCRHTFAAEAARNGVPLSVIQSILGHSSSTMTSHYTDHITIADKIKAFAALSGKTAEDTLRDKITAALHRLNADQLQQVLTQIQGVKQLNA